MRGKPLLTPLILLLTLQSFLPPASHASQATVEESPFLNFQDEDQLQDINKQIEQLVAAGQYEVSLGLSQKAARLAQEQFGNQHIEYAKALNNLGWHEQTTGDYKRARHDFDSAVKIYETAYGPDSPQVATVLNNLALLLCFQGDFDTALPLLNRVLTLQVLALGTSHAELLYTLNNLAAVQSSLGNEADSKKNLERALALNGVTDVVAKTQTLNNLSMLSQRDGDLQSASNYLEQAVKLRVDASKQREPDMIEVLNNLALIKFSLGQTEQAKKTLSEALDLTRATLGENHIDYATTLSNVAMIEYYCGDKQAAQTDFLRIATAVDNHVSNVLPALSFAEQRAFLSRKIPLTTSQLISANIGSTQAAGIYDHIFRWKGLLIESLRWQSALSKKLGVGKTREELNSLVSVRHRLATLFNQTSSVDFNEWQKQFKLLSRQKEELERTIFQQSEHDELHDVLTGMSLSSFLKLLKDDELLVDMYVYRRMDDNRKKHYAAFVSDNSGQVTLIDLGPCQIMDGTVLHWREAVLDMKPNEAQLEQLQRLTLDKFTSHPLAQKKRRIFFSPDGEMSRFPLNIFAAASGSSIEFAELDSPRELAYLRRDASEAQSEPRTKMLVVGGVDFGKGDGTFHFPSLPGTIKEARAVMAIAASGGITSEFITGREAGKSKVLEAMTRVDIAHLATHGIFSDAGFSMQELKLKVNAGTDVDTGKESSRNPLLSSSLVFAASSELGADDRPEMLTAEELVNADLKRCQFIVLSACETGLGSKETGQGILGLRASIMAAGARTLVMSLWKVPDLPTTLLMEKFYDNLLKEKQPAALALVNAQKYVRVYADGAFKNPINWGAWVLVGDGW